MDLGIGACFGTPVADAEVLVAPPILADDPASWSVALAPEVRLSATASGHLAVVARGQAKMLVSPHPSGGRAEIAPPLDHLQAQLLASYGLPLLLPQDRVLVLHAAAAARGGSAVVFAGDGGCGKSSALAVLASRGWTSITEDVCALDLAAERPQAWPGPPWVRLRDGTAGPPGSAALFSNGTKTAWDLSGRHAMSSVAVDRIVLLGRGSAEPRWASLSHPAAIGAVAQHAVWLGNPADRGRGLFPLVARATAAVEVTTLSLPETESWGDVLVAELEGTTISAPPASQGS